MTARLYLDVHALHTVPPSNLNRDDTGSPKSCVYGGVRRARVSSQAWKRAIRTDFATYIDGVDLGVRTKRAVGLIAQEIASQRPDLGSDAVDLAVAVLDAAGLKPEKPKRAKKAAEGEPVPEVIPEISYLLFLSHRQVESLASLAVSSATDGVAITRKAAQAVFAGKNSIDLALFGRMVADVADLNVDAAAQVAHAISVHAVSPEFDYFTAVDDAKASAVDEDAGAGMIGTVEFHSSTLYRYATVDVFGLQDNLGEGAPTPAAVRSFVHSFITSMPTGKQNTFAARTLPDAVVVCLRLDRPISFAGAFEEPVVSDSGRVEKASERMAAHAIATHDAYGAHPVATWVVGVGESTRALASIGESTSLPAMLDAIESSIAQRLSAQA